MQDKFKVWSSMVGHWHEIEDAVSELKVQYPDNDWEYSELDESLYNRKYYANEDDELTPKVFIIHTYMNRDEFEKSNLENDFMFEGE